MILKRISAAVLIVFIFVLQSSLFCYLTINGASPDLLLIVVVVLAMLRGKSDGMAYGFGAGLLWDIFYSSIIGFNALLYMFIGFVCGHVKDIIVPFDMKLPAIGVSLGKLFALFFTYIVRFLLFGNFALGTYFVHIMLPEFLYTMGIFAALNPLLMLLEFKVLTKKEE